MPSLTASPPSHLREQFQAVGVVVIGEVDDPVGINDLQVLPEPGEARVPLQNASGLPPARLLGRRGLAGQRALQRGNTGGQGYTG